MVRVAQAGLDQVDLRNPMIQAVIERQFGVGFVLVGKEFDNASLLR
jgi:hypothetical protein